MKNRFLIISSLLILALTTLISVSAQAQAYDPLRITGTVESYSPADCGKAGSIRIAGQTLTIAAGVDTLFADVMQVVRNDNTLGNGAVKSEVWQVVNTVRQIGVYLDPQNRIRLQVATSTPITSSRAFDVTGVVTAFTAATATTAGSVTIHGLTFAIAPGSTVAAAVSPSVVRLIGVMNSGNQVTVSSVGDPYRKLTVCGAPNNMRTPGITFEVPDVEAFDPAGPISGFVFSAATPFGTNIQGIVLNPLGTAASVFLCDESVDFMSIDGSASIPFAPNFSIRDQVSKDVYACFEFNIDALGWASNGSKKIPTTKTSGGTVQGIFEAFRPATTLFPTNNSESAQQGLITLSGRTFVAASGVTVPLNGATAGANPLQTVCLQMVIDPAGQTAPFLTGQQAPPRAGQLINGTKITPGACP